MYIINYYPANPNNPTNPGSDNWMNRITNVQVSRR